MERGVQRPFFMPGYRMAELFKAKVRTRSSAARMGERTYSFIDQSAWPACDAYRSLANRWISIFPPSHQAELVHDIKRGDERAFHSRMLEIVVGALLDGLGFGFEPHPQLPGTDNKPDFELLLGNPPLRSGLVEVTTIMPSQDAVAGGRRSTVLYEAIDEIRMPIGCVLDYSLVSIGKDSPSLFTIRTSVQQWVDSISAISAGDHAGETFCFSDWSFELELWNVGNEKQYDHAIHLSSGHGGFSATPSKLRSRLKPKSKRYGPLDHPYILIVGDTAGLTWGLKGVAAALSEAMFGDEQVTVTPEMKVHPTRSRNGFWLGPDGPRNTHVSAVLFFPDVGIWGLRNDLHKPLLAVNPWSGRPMPPEFECLTRLVVEDDHWKILAGRDVADVIGLPQEWPPPRC